MSFFFNQVVTSNSNSNLSVSNSLIFKELGKIDFVSSNLFGSYCSAWFNFAGLTFVSFTLVGFTSLASDFDNNFDNNLLLAPLSIFYSTLPHSPTSRFFLQGPGSLTNVSCFDHLVYLEPLLSYFKHLYFSCQVCFADNLLHFRRNLLLSNPAMPCSSNTNLHHYISFVPSLQPYYNFIDNYFILNGLQSSCLELDYLASTSLPSFSLSDQVTIPSNFPSLSSQAHDSNGGIFFQFSLPKLRLSSFPFALYISRPSSLVPCPKDSHPLVPLHFNRSFYSQNLPSYVGFLGSLIPSSTSDFASPVDESIGNSVNSISNLACHSIKSIRNINNISSDSGDLSTCEISSLHYFLNLRSRTASFFAFLDSFFLIDSSFLDSLPWLGLSSSDILFSSNRSNSLLSNLNQLHQTSFCLGDAHFLFNNQLDKLLVSSTYALCDEHFLFNDPLFSINREHFCPYEEHFYSNKEHFLLAEEHFLLDEEHFLFNNRTFASNISFLVKPLTSHLHLASLSHFFANYASLTNSNFSSFNCFSSFSTFVGLVTFSSFAHTSIYCSVFSFANITSNHMDIVNHLDISNSCPDVNFSFSSLHTISPSWFPSHHSTFDSQNISQNAIPFLIFISHNRIFECQNISTFFNLAHPNPVSKLPNALTFNIFFSNLTVTLSVLKLPNSIFLSAFSCKNLITFQFSPSILKVFELPNLSILLFWPSKSNVFSGLNRVTFQFGSSNSNIFSSQKQYNLLNRPSNLSHFSCKNKYHLLNLPSNLKFSSSQKESHLLNLASFLNHFSSPNSTNLRFWPSTLSALSRKNKSVLFNLASTLSFSSHKNKRNLRFWPSFLSAFLDNNSSTFLYSPSLKALLLKHSSSFSGSTSKQTSNNLIKKANNLRSHYRIKISFEAKVDSHFAISLARNYLLQQFPNAILLAACHQNTNHTHIHVLLFARDLDGKKLHFSNSTYKKLDIGWAKLYAKAFGHHKLEQHIQKKAQSRNWKFDRVLGIDSQKPYRISISNRLDHSKNYADSYKNLSHLTDIQRPLNLLLNAYFVKSDLNNLANPDKNLVINRPFKLNHISHFDKNLAFELKFLPLNSNHLTFSVDRNLANNPSSSLSTNSKSLSFADSNLFFDVKNASNFDKSDPLNFSFSNHNDVFGSAKESVFWNSNLSFSAKQQDFLIKQQDFFGTQLVFFDKQQAFLTKQPDFFNTFFDHNLTFSHNFLHKQPGFFDNRFSLGDNLPVDFSTCSQHNAVLDNKEHLHLLPSINFNLDHNQLFLDHKLPFWNNNPLDFAACSTFNSVLDNKELHHLHASINLFDNFAEKHLAFNSSVIEKTSAFNTSFSDKDFVSNALIVDKIVDKNLVSNNVFLDKDPVSNDLIVDKDIVSNRPDHDKVTPIDKDLVHHRPSHNLTHHHDLKLNQTLNPFSYHHYLDLIENFERDYLHCLSERVLLEREFGDTLFNEVDKDFGQKPFPDARFLDNDTRLVGNDFDERNLVGKAPAGNDFDHTSIEPDHDYDEPIR